MTKQVNIRPHDMTNGLIRSVAVGNGEVYRLRNPVSVDQLEEVARNLRSFLETFQNGTATKATPNVTHKPAKTAPRPVQKKASNYGKRVAVYIKPSELTPWPVEVEQAVSNAIREGARSGYVQADIDAVLNNLGKNPKSTVRLHNRVRKQMGLPTLVMVLEMLRQQGKVRVTKVHPRLTKVERIF